MMSHVGSGPIDGFVVKGQTPSSSALDVCDSNRSTNYSNSSQAVYNAWNNGGNLSNRSFGGPELKEELDAIYSVVLELYKEHIVPSVHEIRRRLCRNRLPLIDGQRLLKICAQDYKRRFELVQLAVSKVADVQRSWAVALKGTRLEDLQDVGHVNLDLLVEIFNYAVAVSSSAGTSAAANASAAANVHSDAYKNGAALSQASGANNRGAGANASANEDASAIRFNRAGPNLHDGGKAGLTIGGRHLFAEHLKDHGPFLFRKMPLGRVVAIVQAAIDLKILVYRENNLVPVVSSPAAARGLLLRMETQDSEAFQRRQEIVDTIGKNIVLLLEERLRKVRSSEKNSEAALSLCKLPSVYRLRFGMELDYSAGGHDKLADFIRKRVPQVKVIGHQCCLANSILDVNATVDGPRQKYAADSEQRSSSSSASSSFASDADEAVLQRQRQQVELLEHLAATTTTSTVLYPLVSGLSTRRQYGTVWTRDASTSGDAWPEYKGN